MESFKCPRALSPLLQTPRNERVYNGHTCISTLCGASWSSLAGVTSNWCGVAVVVVVKHLNINPGYHTGVRIISFAVIKG